MNITFMQFYVSEEFDIWNPVRSAAVKVHIFEKLIQISTRGRTER